MATQTVTEPAKTVTDESQQRFQGASDKVQGYTSGILDSIDGYFGKLKQWAMGLLDRFWPPEQRAAFLTKLQDWMLSNPKLSTFLGMNIMITGLPLGVFILFTITVLIFSLIVGLVLGLLAAVLFTLFMVGVALSIVLPFVFFTTMVACFLFLWGLGGYYIIKWANKRGSVAEEGGLFGDGTVGDSVNKMTGGLLTGFMDKAKAKNDIKGFGDEQTKPVTGQANGQATGPKKDQKQS